MSNGAPIKVVIIGGGAAGVATAFWLTAPEQNNRYQVTLYTQGWRLGGKCASGRNLSTGDRIEEHGLHMLMGCYQNAFATLRACYDDWTPPPLSPITNWTDAFLPQRQLTLMEQDGRGGGWSPWNFGNLPQLPGQPGDGYGVSLFATVAQNEQKTAAREYQKDEMHRLVLKLADWLEQSVHAQKLVDGGAAAIQALRAPLINQTDDLKQRLAVLGTANEQLSTAIDGRTKRRRHELSLAVADSTTRLEILANLGFAMGAGYFRDIVFQGDDAYDKLNALDFRAWLSTCGAASQTLAAAPIRALYDLAFAFPGGVANDIDLGSIAAGVTFRFAMEVAFGYNDAPLWKMAAGMGDIVFAPFYQVLEARQPGCVKFFSRLADMSAGADGRIQSVVISIQAVTADGTPYRPLASLKGLACWPNQPDWDQLQNGSVLQGAVNFESSFCTVSVGSKTLTVDQDFDLVVLAIPPAATLKTPATFAQGSAIWQAALQDSSSVATQSLQLWMNKTVANLGWMLGPTVLTAFAEDYDSWGDMSHLLPMETWSGPDAPQAIGYFVGCLPVPPQPPPTPSSMQQAATQLADQWIGQSLSALWPDYPQSQVVSRYDIANFDGSDLYVLTPGGTNVANRLSSAAPADFSNLYVAGDWTRTRFSGGCFESAIESAMLASRAISGIPQQIKTT
jgi:uncharacterized protein with NAD-binding domain and iron-sulfur cluster